MTGASAPAMDSVTLPPTSVVAIRDGQALAVRNQIAQVLPTVMREAHVMTCLIRRDVLIANRVG